MGIYLSAMEKISGGFLIPYFFFTGSSRCFERMMVLRISKRHLRSQGGLFPIKTGRDSVLDLVVFSIILYLMSDTNFVNKEKIILQNPLKMSWFSRVHVSKTLFLHDTVNIGEENVIEVWNYQIKYHKLCLQKVYFVLMWVSVTRAGLFYHLETHSNRTRIIFPETDDESHACGGWVSALSHTRGRRKSRLKSFSSRGKNLKSRMVHCFVKGEIILNKSRGRCRHLSCYNDAMLHRNNVHQKGFL